ncbi:hypothetical protein [Ferroplasma sp.]|uniref:hypothetical protein n=1 Tax=Ferroplasma sp. TaxID=2591003 RepID=UPI00260A8C13|nr:hypothetical protein [Ferroplasma sp.]
MVKSTKERQKLERRDTYTPADVSHGKSIIAEGGETKMNINIKKVKLVKYGEGLRLTIQFLSTLPYGISLEGVR